MLGNNYGREFLPKTLSMEKYDAFQSVHHHTETKSLDLIDEWYKKDYNAIPHVYVLQVSN
jgi:hypothetical protein